MMQPSKRRTLAIWLMLLGFVLASGANRRSGCCCVMPDAAALEAQIVSAEDAAAGKP